MSKTFESWGRYPKANHTLWESHAGALLPETTENDSLLAVGMGKSYGDSCLNNGHTLVSTSALHEWKEADETIVCDAGVTLADILSKIVPEGKLLPVLPGTKFVTVGGAIANDVHGKNHSRAGTFGRYVVSLDLLRSDGTLLHCSENENTELFRATVGGLGLTGLIVRATLKLRTAPSPWIEEESVKCATMIETLETCMRSAETHEYVVGWMDCMASGHKYGRGLVSRGNHVPNDHPFPSPHATFTVPPMPVRVINRYGIKMFNALRYHRQKSTLVSRVTGYDPFFFPLDVIQRWNRLYGRKGFFQYQPVTSYEGATEILEKIREARVRPFLTAIKKFGAISSPGLLSYPREGVCLAFDFPNVKEVFELLDQLDAIVMKHDGAVYPAKDARMSAQAFQSYFPAWEGLRKEKDPAFCSDFWRRVTR